MIDLLFQMLSQDNAKWKWTMLLQQNQVGSSRYFTYEINDDYLSIFNVQVIIGNHNSFYV